MIGANAEGHNQITNLTTTIQTPATAPVINKPTGDMLNNAATIGDVLHAG